MFNVDKLQMITMARKMHFTLSLEIKGVRIGTFLQGAGLPTGSHALLQWRYVLIWRIFLGGVVFFFLVIGLSNVGAQEEELLDQQPLEGFRVEERLGSPIERSSSISSSIQERSHIAALEAPLSGEFLYDFNLELLLGDWPKKEPRYDIPIVVNGQVEHCIVLFQTTIRERFVTWLSRSGKYIPFMRNLLKEQGLPEDLVYMALIESGFDPYAYSRSKAVGPWQFIDRTGKRYGLKVNWWVDERRDPEKSTIAAAKYLKDLYEMFACWYLAAAGYNAGEYKIIRAMKRYRTEDFWTLTKHQYLKRETKNYVPLMIAAAIVAKEPEKYGFTGIEYEQPLRYEKVKVPELTDLSHIAKACEISLQEIKDLNPELRRGVTPPNEPEYEIKIPFDKIDLFTRNFEAMQPLEKFPFKTHTVKKGETLRGIAKLYRVDLDPLLEINYLNKTSALSKGTDLLIPISKDEEIRPPAVAPKKIGKARNGNGRGK
jgi:membrane-bound lytic murein transglycosylase D